jgi:hypothetical protein
MSATDALKHPFFENKFETYLGQVVKRANEMKSFKNLLGDKVKNVKNVYLNDQHFESFKL